MNKNKRDINATLTRCRHGQALVVLNSEPFNGWEIRPHELKILAQRLIALAEMANRLPTGGKHYRPTSVALKTGAVVELVISGKFTPEQMEILDQWECEMEYGNGKA